MSEPLHSAPELLRLAASNAISPEEFERQLSVLSKGHERLARLYENGDVRIYRSTVWPRMPTINSAANEPERPKSIKDLRYPPKENACLNRANLEGEPVFYASAGLPPTFVECQLKKGQYAVGSEWRTTIDLLLQEVGLSNDGTMSDVERIYRDIFTSTNREMYKFSARVARNLLGSDDNPISGLMYPSIAAQNGSENFALTTRFVDTGLRFVNASLYYIKNVTDPFQYECDELDFAIPNCDGSLNWKGRKRQWVAKQGDKLKMITNGWAWNAYDVTGALIDPE